MDPTSLEWDIAFALKQRAPVRLKREVDAELIARAIAEHLRMARWEFRRLPSEPTAPSRSAG